jgi:hypothetical protein
MASAAAIRKNFFAQKKSEYRQNYLPFDYYDFWVTSKENENLRCRNKLRDYLHTPFDWDEDQDFYLETQVNQVDVVNHATQTTTRPNRRDHLQKVHNAFAGYKHKQSNDQETQNNNQVNQKQQSQNQKKNLKNKQEEKKTERPKSSASSIVQQQESVQRKPRKNKKKSGVAKSARAINFEQQSHQGIRIENSYSKLNDGQGVVSKPGRVRSSSAREPSSYAENFVQKQNSNLDQVSQKLAKSISNIAIQTPLGWNLRDFNNEKQSRASSSTSKSKPHMFFFYAYYR